MGGVNMKNIVKTVLMLQAVGLALVVCKFIQDFCDLVYMMEAHGHNV